MNKERESTEIENKLKLGAVKFKYFKKDGSDRIAFGTLNPNMIPNHLKREVEKIIITGVSAIDLLGRSIQDRWATDRQSKDIAFEVIVDEWNKLVSPSRKKPIEQKDSDYIVYYDFECKGFRQFRKTTAIIL